MNVYGTNAANYTSDNVATKKPGTTADYQTFLKLLVEQIKNQDPTNPSSSTDLLAQLASFSGVEQQTVTNAKLDALSASMSLVQSASLVGMRVTSQDGTVDGRIMSVESIDGLQIATLNNGAMVSLSDQLRISRYE